MRECLHQLSLALALPITVAAVWAIRGEPAGAAPTQRATAYRVELAELPLPTPKRLRAPHGASDWSGAQAMPVEDPIARRRRPTLPGSLAAAQPVEFAAETGSKPDRYAGASPRVAPPEPPLATPPNVPAPQLAEPIVSTLPIVTRRAISAAAQADSTATQPDSTATPTNPAADAGRGTVAAPKAEPAAEVAVYATAPPRLDVANVSPAPALRESVAKPAPVVTAVRSVVAPPRDEAPSEDFAGDAKFEKTWREGVAATPSSPALAHATREPKQSLDLALERGASQRSLLDKVLPTATAPTPSQLKPFAWDPTPNASAHVVPEAPPRLLDLPSLAREVFARSSDDDAEEASPVAGSISRHFLPVFALLAIPEPGSAALLGAALALLAAAQRRERRA